ncbi:zinc ABC transporter substrate-binding protein [Thiomonas bhubaneswarensis]|uniref:High-affinity zinc uptake system protein ZnuA n=1 Tax=Thiomonas bhubaneswarensis TaxID=339866 RepID=A0A0K6I6C2_9BURK|nr:zinc ABC transporter substrate-binding protein [Thiomonas bhubaneswarensis]CUA98862.1 ABC-type Zn2+ transport system, periplasmic component/surface adhesin [Thiomonas bhubaneswarensis]
MLKLSRIAVFCTVLVAILRAPLAGAEPVKVAVSIKPVGDLVAAVMQGVGTPSVLIPPGRSPHTYALKPSERAAAEQAQVVFWIGPDVEPALNPVTRSLPKSTEVVTLSTAPGMNLLPARQGGDWERKRPAPKLHHDGEDHEQEHAHTGSFDGHLWLSPTNAKTIVRTAERVLAAKDPAHAAQYQANADKAVQTIDAMTAELTLQLQPVKHKPFIVFHDAYQYFEHAFGLRAVGSLLVSPEAMANARRVSQMRDKIQSLGVVCVFTEPQFEPKLVQTLVEGTPVRVGTLDPLGAKGPLGLAGYTQLMRQLATNLSQCLSAR